MFRHSKRIAIFLLLSGAPLFGVACGDDSKSNSGAGGSGDFSTSITGNADLGTLSKSDKIALCADVNSYANSAFPNSREKICTIVGSVLAARDASTSEADARDFCADKRDECLEQDDDFLDDECLDDVTADCSATVNEYAACVKARTAQVKAIFDNVLSCSDVTLGYLDGDIAPNFLKLPSECNIIKTVCPDALDDGDIFDDDLYEDYDIFE